ncbi:hypothetical protein BF93_12465 [Brachybacterium phenoliresistens]|uniref:HNH nuclease domain-containing protein n=1 Tax=Brachybacterium phenoliresistens TaxID=396014 RepID=Z9JX87_9MICO|nr:HNH endonuclease [Brachybacterium phenoliresistens]EWS82402.1 hypothetical protein BF93_12465 [Brachybacterium phenoliresistens]
MKLLDPDTQIARERDLIADLDIERPAWQFRRGRRGGTRSLASFTYALSMPDAPTALAMLRSYMCAVGLDKTDRWSVSAMPSWAGATDEQRFATVSGANIELFYVWFESSSGLVTSWGARIPKGLDRDLPALDELRQSTADNGDIGVHGETLGDLFAALSNRDFLEVLSATWNQRQGTRRSDWHNPYLGALLGFPGTTSGAESEPSGDEEIEFERRYIQRVTRQRLHQAPLREAALQRYGARCMYCGLDVPQVLEAAHIIPDSQGGAASTSNVRVLCANHHAAFDAKLLLLEGEDLVRAPGAPHVPPSRPVKIAVPVKTTENQTYEEDDSQDEDRYRWIVTDPGDLTPLRLGDTVLYDPADDSDEYTEGLLLGIHFVSENASRPQDVTYQLEIKPTNAEESVTITVTGDGYVSRYIDTEDPDEW